MGVEPSIVGTGGAVRRAAGGAATETVIRLHPILSGDYLCAALTALIGMNR